MSYFYHGTTDDVVDRVKREGLKANPSLCTRAFSWCIQALYLTTELSDAKFFSEKASRATAEKYGKLAEYESGGRARTHHPELPEAAEVILRIRPHKLPRCTAEGDEMISDAIRLLDDCAIPAADIEICRRPLWCDKDEDWDWLLNEEAEAKRRQYLYEKR